MKGGELVNPKKKGGTEGDYAGEKKKVLDSRS